MSYLALHKERKRANTKVRKLKNKLEAAKSRLQYIDDDIWRRAGLDDQFEALVAEDKRDAVIKLSTMSSISAWKAYVNHDADAVCSAEECPSDGDKCGRFYVSCTFDRQDSYRYCHQCFKARNFDIDRFISETERLKKEYLAHKNSRPYMAGHEIALAASDDAPSA